MFYPKSKDNFSVDEFKNPDKEYRAAPFWSWNTKLDKDELMRQIGVLKEMGFGGFHIHSRTGMATPYLSEQYFDLVGSCVDKAKNEDMLVYLYDEDRWPSGSAGGLVTKKEEFRQIYLRFMSHTDKNERNEIVGVYDIDFNEDRTVKSYKKISENQTAKNEKWYAYVEVIEIGNPWFNYQCYVDMLNPEAIAEFIKITHESYKKHFEKDFKKTVRSIFTDEPQVTRKNIYDHKNDDFMIPWTKKFCEKYTDTYNKDILDTLPEIFFEIAEQEVSQARYNYHELTTEMFATAFTDQCGKWCDDNNFQLTGHVMSEGDLIGQTLAVGDAMRHYRHFTLPGIDMLMAGHEFTTAKQVESMQRQKNAEGILCELDGVTNWDFDFRGHKLHGDWQAALGVTLRVPHLSWVSMNGEAKRDYPASINYQAAWYKKYHLVEDYFARVNSILSRGKADCKVAVLHPIRNAWIALGTFDNTHDRVAKYNKAFSEMTKALVKNHVDFDFISESNLEYQNAHFKDSKFYVENCEYDVVIIPEMISLKSSTVKILSKAKVENSTVLAFGNAPEYVDAAPSDKAIKLYNDFIVKEYSIENIINSINNYRDVEIKENNELSENYCYQLKTDGDQKWLFIAKCVDPDNNDEDIHTLTVKIQGEFDVSEYSCKDGNIYTTNYKKENGYTVVTIDVFAHDSIMLHLTNTPDTVATTKKSFNLNVNNKVNGKVKYKLLEENVYLIDKAEFKLDDGEFEPLDEILRKENSLRARLGIKQRGEGFAQPWVDLESPKPEHEITLRTTFESKIDYQNAILALETPEDCIISFNGNNISNQPIGWYVDKCIKKIKLGNIKKGKNELIVKMPFGLTTNAEYMYILGSFGVYDTKTPYINTLPETIDFGDISKQGLMFYGGNIEYYLTTNKNAKTLQFPSYKGGMIEVLANNKTIANIIESPYICNIEGQSNIIARVYGTRINTFGQLHLVPHDKFGWFGPYSWRTGGSEWTYDYLPWEQGILSNPLTD